jgi:O-antigen/teichoic acid export membrane protein
MRMKLGAAFGHVVSSSSLGGGVWSMSDQAIVSIGNFLLTIALARTMTHAEYGGYVVAYGALYFAHAVHNALVVYPVSIFGAHHSRSQLRALASESLLITYALALPSAALVATAVSLLLHRSDLNWLLLGALLAWQTQETLRRALMSHLRHRAAITGDAVTAITQISCVAVALVERMSLNAESGLRIIMISSLAGAAVHIAVLGLGFPALRELGKRALQFFQLGRWWLITGIGFAGTVLLFPWWLAHRNLAEAAIYQAMLNIVQVGNPVAFSVGNLVIPAVAHEMLKPAGDAGAKRITRMYMFQGLLILAPLFLGLLLVPGFVMRVAYGAASGYAQHTIILRVLALGWLATYVGHVLNSYALGRKMVVETAGAQVASSVCAIVAAALFIPTYGIGGAAIGYLVMGVARNCSLLVSFAKNRERERQHVFRTLAPSEGTVEPE